LQQLQLVEVDAGQANDVITTLEMGVLSTVYEKKQYMDPSRVVNGIVQRG